MSKNNDIDNINYYLSSETDNTLFYSTSKFPRKDYIKKQILNDKNQIRSYVIFSSDFNQNDKKEFEEKGYKTEIFHTNDFKNGKYKELVTGLLDCEKRIYIITYSILEVTPKIYEIEYDLHAKLLDIQTDSNQTQAIKIYLPLENFLTTEMFDELSFVWEMCQEHNGENFNVAITLLATSGLDEIIGDYYYLVENIFPMIVITDCINRDDAIFFEKIFGDILYESIIDLPHYKKYAYAACIEKEICKEYDEDEGCMYDEECKYYEVYHCSL